jgi:transcription elongation factor Elf1
MSWHLDDDGTTKRRGWGETRELLPCPFCGAEPIVCVDAHMNRVVACSPCDFYVRRDVWDCRADSSVRGRPA